MHVQRPPRNSVNCLLSLAFCEEWRLLIASLVPSSHSLLNLLEQLVNLHKFVLDIVLPPINLSVMLSEKLNFGPDVIWILLYNLLVRFRVATIRLAHNIHRVAQVTFHVLNHGHILIVVRVNPVVLLESSLRKGPGFKLLRVEQRIEVIRGNFGTLIHKVDVADQQFDLILIRNQSGQKIMAEGGW